MLKLQNFVARQEHLILPKTLSNCLSTPPPKLFITILLLPPQSCRLHIRRTLIIGTVQQTNHTQQYCFWRLDRTPSLARLLISVFIVFGGVEDRNAEFAVGVDIWVERNRILEGKTWGEERVLGREGEVAAEIASSVVFAVVIDHEHYFPLKDIVIHQPA